MEEKKLANECAMMFVSGDKALMDRQLFVRNLGELLSQTRENVVSCELDDHEVVTVTFRYGYTERINVNMDSYMAIISDVLKCVR